ncbi:DUF6296 family protein [Kitasatospora sp. NPDC048540]|uniref:DUF6296 family protein n=1 Tax=unclassified Kitasatospora TaxID=2633591 RepID=UPI00053987C5|nr:DUF6296 family protein [Kitasatospora sp. MBT63]
MADVQRFAITVPSAPGTHAAPEVITVHTTGALGDGGGLICADAAGSLTVEITGETALVLTPSGGQHRCLHAVLLP